MLSRFRPAYIARSLKEKVQLLGESVQENTSGLLPSLGLWKGRGKERTPGAVIKEDDDPGADEPGSEREEAGRRERESLDSAESPGMLSVLGPLERGERGERGERAERAALLPSYQTAPGVLEQHLLRSALGFAPAPSRPLVELTPLAYVPNYSVVRYIGRCNLHFIRESSLRETWGEKQGGGLGQFFHNFLCEAMAVARAHVLAFNGNVLLSFHLTPRESSGKGKTVYHMISLSGDIAHIVPTEELQQQQEQRGAGPRRWASQA
jgi:hypothetical protein